MSDNLPDIVSYFPLFSMMKVIDIYIVIFTVKMRETIPRHWLVMVLQNL
jgi:hypothetical protein